MNPIFSLNFTLISFAPRILPKLEMWKETLRHNLMPVKCYFKLLMVTYNLQFRAINSSEN